MKRIILASLFLGAFLNLNAQNYEFQTVKDHDALAVLSQGQTGTCWSFSTASFLESEIIRKTGKHIDLSEMYNVRHVYPKKAENYILRQGKAQFGEGGLAHDVINSMRDAGLVPFEVYSGLEGAETYNHEELFHALKSVLEAFATSKGPISPKWQGIVSYILDSYLGENITEFTYQGKTYTPQSFLKMTGLHPDDYITITSFQDKANYRPFILNVPDNFSNGMMYNLPLDEYIQNIDHALEKGFTLSLDCDVSEKGFSAKHGIAVVPENSEDLPLGLTEIIKERTITGDYRLQEFYNFNTQDDHLMHIVGKVKDQKGTTYYKVKNSWGSEAHKVAHGGYIYMSVPYMQLKSISVLLHKDGLEKNTLKKISL